VTADVGVNRAWGAESPDNTWLKRLSGFWLVNLLSTMFANKVFQLLRRRKTPYESAI
jgi:hypothetical protein